MKTVLLERWLWPIIWFYQDHQTVIDEEDTSIHRRFLLCGRLVS